MDNKNLQKKTIKNNKATLIKQIEFACTLRVGISS